MYLHIGLQVFDWDWLVISFPTSPCPSGSQKSCFPGAVSPSMGTRWQWLFTFGSSCQVRAKGEKKSVSLGAKVLSEDIWVGCGDRCWLVAHRDKLPSETEKLLLQRLGAILDQCVTARQSWGFCAPSPPLVLGTTSSSDSYRLLPA